MGKYYNYGKQVKATGGIHKVNEALGIIEIERDEDPGFMFIEAKNLQESIGKLTNEFRRELKHLIADISFDFYPPSMSCQKEGKCNMSCEELLIRMRLFTHRNFPKVFAAFDKECVKLSQFLVDLDEMIEAADHFLDQAEVWAYLNPENWEREISSGELKPEQYMAFC